MAEMQGISVSGISATNGTSKSYPSKDQGPLRRRRQKDGKLQILRRTRAKECLLDTEELWHVALMNKIKSVNIMA